MFFGYNCCFFNYCSHIFCVREKIDNTIIYIIMINKNMNYIANSDTIIFAPEFNDELDINLITNYTKLIFSDYKLNERLFNMYNENKDCNYLIHCYFNYSSYFDYSDYFDKYDFYDKYYNNCN